MRFFPLKFKHEICKIYTRTIKIETRTTKIVLDESQCGSCIKIKNDRKQGYYVFSNFM